MPLDAKLLATPTKRLLAIDGGGVRGLLAIEILARLEIVLRQSLGRDGSFCLADYFDFVGGTSTGAILATCLALGMPVPQIREIALATARDMFDKAGFQRRFWYKYDDAHIASRLRDVFRGYLTDEDRSAGHTDITLGTSALRTLLLVVMRNATTDSPWPLSNNPRAKFNNRSRADCNLGVPLWQLVRASTAAPTFFPPEDVQVGPERFLFVDGGVTPYNNPALLLFVMASSAPYQLAWPTGADRMLLVSVGTGRVRHARPDLRAADLNLLYNAAAIPDALLSATQVEQDLLCRTFGRCRKGDPLDQEVGTLIDATIPPLPRTISPSFTYLRYDADLSQTGLAGLGFPLLQPERVQKLDSVDSIEALRSIGEAAARQVESSDFEGFLAP
jgi:predicted acylesterase/phospholipase RssA